MLERLVYRIIFKNKNMLQINQKFLIIIISSLALLSIVILGYFAFKSNNTPVTNLVAERVSVAGKNNQEVSVKNFYLNPVEESPGAVTFNRTTDLATYFYNDDGNKFSISLNEGTQEEFFAKKPLAEQEFLKLLDITADQACLLNIQVVNAGSNDPVLEGNAFAFSVCN
jgi:hypothetical protein